MYLYINTTIDVYNYICIIYVFIDKQIICTLCIYIYGRICAGNFWKAVPGWIYGSTLLPSTAPPSTAPPFVLPVSWNTKVVASSLEKPNINAMPGHSGSSPPNIFLRFWSHEGIGYPNGPQKWPRKRMGGPSQNRGGWWLMSLSLQVELLYVIITL